MKRNTITGSLAAFTLALSILVQDVPAQPQYVSYQGELLDDGAPVTDTARMKFAIVSSGVTLWSNDNSSVSGAEPSGFVTINVSSGVFNVLLGASPMTPLTAHALSGTTGASLRIWVDTPPFDGFEQLSDVPLASGAFALQSDGARRATSGFDIDGDLQVFEDGGQRTVYINADEGTTGALMYIYDIDSGGTARPAIELDSREGSGGGVVRLYNGIEGGTNPNQPTIEINAQEGTGPGQIVLFDNEGNVAIELDAEMSDGNSRIIADVVQINGGLDVAEHFPIGDDTEKLPAGTVVSIDPANTGHLTPSAIAYDKRVAGIISGAGGVNVGMVLSQESMGKTGDYPVALSGRVYCQADASYGAIQPGDLLTTSPTRGHAMKVTDPGRAHGAVIGKAMSSLTQGTGLVLVLVTLQ